MCLMVRLRYVLIIAYHWFQMAAIVLVAVKLPTKGLAIRDIGLSGL
jgi:hypothetical protein